MSDQPVVGHFNGDIVNQMSRIRCSVTEVSKGADVSAPKRYQPENAVKFIKTVNPMQELQQAKDEVLELREQLRQLAQERDLLREGAWFYASLRTPKPVS